ncbi:hypothetical protein [Aliidiomarina sanyensis]|uniref:Uncharacterized protein n=1 Tax=Aliidiomarina sanyensis TaxID=1249555 RepID=A0A432WR45_9GAMM|nr:hypothetical protein [Aliidiomarina sanyensis]RUO36253.1 hypothetical protein CWE11_00065 [Aliidiomarina sanyensis]
MQVLFRKFLMFFLLLGVIGSLGWLGIGRGYQILPAWGLLLVVGAFAWMYFNYLSETRLIRRHALLNYALRENSALKQWLWDGFFTQFVHALSAWLLAIAVLIFCIRMRLDEWIAVAVGVLLFALVYTLSRERFCRQFTDHVAKLMQVRFSLWVSVGLVAVGLSIWHLFFLDLPDLRGRELSAVLHEVWSERSETRIPGLGAFLQVDAVLRHLLWFALQSAQQFPVFLSPWTQFILWFGVFLLNALKLGLIGVLLLASVLPGQQGRIHKSAALDRKPMVWGSMLGLLAPAVLLAMLVYLGPNAWEQRQARTDRAMSSESSTPGQIDDPCAPDVLTAEIDQLSAEGESQLRRRERELNRALEAKLVREVERAFGPAEQAVDQFLDWNFSVRGQYQQLGMLLASSMTEEAFATRLAERLEAQLSAALSPELTRLQRSLDAEYAAALSGLIRQHERWMTQVQQRAECELQNIRLAPLSIDLASAGVGSGAAVGTLLGGRALVGIGARLTAGAGTRRALAQIFRRAGARAAATAGGAATGSICGPICVAVLGTGAALAADFALVELDEYRNRAVMREEMLEAIREEQVRLVAALHSIYQSEIARVVLAVEAQQNARFNVWRDGINPPSAETPRSELD